MPHGSRQVRLSTAELTENLGELATGLIESAVELDVQSVDFLIDTLDQLVERVDVAVTALARRSPRCAGRGRVVRRGDGIGDAGGDDDLWLPPPQPGAAAMSPAVSQPEVQRQVRQQRADIDALYELVERVDHKVDALDVKLDHPGHARPCLPGRGHRYAEPATAENSTLVSTTNRAKITTTRAPCGSESR